MVGCFLLVVIFGIYLSLVEAKIRKHGQSVIARIVVANDRLYQPLESDKPIEHSYSYAQVVFTRDGNTSDAHLEKLAKYANQLREFKPIDNPGEDERIIGSVMETHVPYPRPLRLPDRLTDSEEVYTVSVRVYWKLLPEGRLTLPYIYCKVLLDKGAVMDEYP